MILPRREFLAASLPSFNPGGAAPLRAPNIVFLLADQWRPQTLPAAGDTNLIAPNLARLGKEGVHCRRAYATNPVCSPSRASILTGRYPHACRVPRNDLPLALEEPSLALELKKAGYATGYIGKWHLDGEGKPGFVPPGPRRRGFDFWAAFNRGHAYYDPTYFGDSPEPVRPGGFEPDYQTDLAIRFIRSHRDRPFFLYLSWGPPHPPRKAPEAFLRRYDPRAFRLAANVPDHYEAKAREGMHGYYALCTAVDANLGRVLAALDELRLADDTIVVFTSDHGDMLGAHGLEFKGLPYEESSRIPLLIRYPRKLGRDVDNDTLVSNADLMPTLLSSCGAGIPESVQGRNLAPLLFEGRGESPESVYAYGRLGTAEEWRMVVRGYDKLVVNARLEATHLYNLGQDPLEMNNLAGEAGSLRKRDELRAVLRMRMRELGDTMDPSGLRLRG